MIGSGYCNKWDCWVDNVRVQARDRGAPAGVGVACPGCGTPLDIFRRDSSIDPPTPPPVESPPRAVSVPRVAESPSPTPAGDDESPTRRPTPEEFLRKMIRPGDKATVNAIRRISDNLGYPWEEVHQAYLEDDALHLVNNEVLQAWRRDKPSREYQSPTESSILAALVFLDRVFDQDGHYEYLDALVSKAAKCGLTVWDLIAARRRLPRIREHRSRFNSRGWYWEDHRDDD